jgi:ABC-type multidrug transport system fused ATPase/permease subunit
MAEIQSGDVLVDGQSIKSFPRNELRRRLFSLPQDPLLLPGTVRFNADPFLEHSDRSILEALEDVGIREVISSRGGLDADLGSITLSKGQQQLFCLTRALLSKSRVILLDEITSNVDAATETAMMKVIERRFADRTVLAIAHRLHTIRNFDKIVVLDKGKIIEVGSPEELLSQESAFRGLWESSHGE